MKDYRQYSMWLSEYPGDLTPRAPLPGPLDVDVAIVGAGYTGLWTAYYLKKADPGIRVVVLEKDIAGYGASGRNGAWCSPLLINNKELMTKTHGRQATAALRQAMHDTIDEIGRVTAEEGIDGGFHKGGFMRMTRTQTQVERMRAWVAYERTWGATEEDVRMLDAKEARERVNVPDTLGAFYWRQAALVDPARLARNLALAVEKLGVPIYEQTPVTAITPHYAHTRQGLVHADVVVRATEAFTADLAGCKRYYVPMYSLMIATEPLPQSVWDEIGWSGFEGMNDARHFIIYLARTEDGRIAMGGRGAPYHFGSSLRDEFERDDRVYKQLCKTLTGLFPVLRDARITHHWGGAVALPRDWFSSAGLDKSTGIAWSGGYGGDGVATSNLGARTVCDLILNENSELARLPWVNHKIKLWEPEPLRWLGVNVSVQATSFGDKEEIKTGRQSYAVKMVKKVTKT